MPTACNAILEVTDALLEKWLTVWESELPEGRATEDAILSQDQQELIRLGRTARAVFGAWTEMIAPLRC